MREKIVCERMCRVSFSPPMTSARASNNEENDRKIDKDIWFVLIC